MGSEFAASALWYCNCHALQICKFTKLQGNRHIIIAIPDSQISIFRNSLFLSTRPEHKLPCRHRSAWPLEPRGGRGSHVNTTLCNRSLHKLSISVLVISSHSVLHPGNAESLVNAKVLLLFYLPWSGHRCFCCHISVSFNLLPICFRLALKPMDYSVENHVLSIKIKHTCFSYMHFEWHE